MIYGVVAIIVVTGYALLFNPSGLLSFIGTVVVFCGMITYMCVMMVCATISEKKGAKSEDSVHEARS